MSTEAKNLIKQLNSEIVNAQESYYSGAPHLSDAEYDALEAQLQALVAKNPEYAPVASSLSKVGTSTANGGRILHARPMLSIENYYTVDTFVKAAANYGPVLDVEPKRDGISSELTYTNGKLTQAVTRGDGEAGEDMTAQVKACKHIPQTISFPGMPKDLRVRGELVMRNAELARINALGGKQYANSRNLTAGTMKQQDLSIVASRNIILLPWDLYSPDADNLLPDSAYDRMKLLFGAGFPHYEGMKVSQLQLAQELHTVLSQIKNADVVCDGVVVKVDSHKLRNSLGVASKYTKYQHCYKPQNLSSTTKLLSIEYGLGRTGKVTPVAILEPVNLGGAMVSRASLNNETYMENLGIMIGAEVEILRSGDVIPFIVKVTSTKGATKLTFPTTCPACGTKLKLDPTSEIVQRYCENSLCKGKAAEHFAYVGNRETLEIDNLGDSMAAELVSFAITDLAKLFEFSNYNLKTTAATFKTAGFKSGANTVKLVKSLQNAKTAKWDRFIASLNIPFIGHSLGKDIAEALNLQPEDMQNLPALLKKAAAMGIAGLGIVKTQSILDWASNPVNVKFCMQLHTAGVRPTSLVKAVAVTGGLSNVNFCITGSFARGSRPGIIEKLEALGAVSHSSVTKNVNLLICGEDAGGKLDKAKKLGIKIVGAEWLDTVLGK